MLKIGDFSKLSRISIRMLRHYDEIGLLVPDSINEFTGYRYYSESQLLIANRINVLKEMGFSLSLIAEILKTYDNPQALRQYLLLKQTEVEEFAEKTSRQLLLLKTSINRLGKDDNFMEYSIFLKEIPKRTVASLREVIPSYDKEGILWDKMMRELNKLNVQYAVPSNSITIFHDKEYKEHDPDLEIQISVQEIYQDTEGVIFKTVPPILVASSTIKGSYDQLGMVNQAVANWVSDNGFEFDGDMFTIYHISPAQTQNPDEFVTEVCFPVRKK